MAGNPFFDHDAERVLLGAILQDSNVATRHLMALTADDMHMDEARAILLAMQELQRQKTPIDMVTVNGQLGRMGKDTLLPELSACVRMCPTTANAEQYYGIIKGCSIRREVYRILSVGTKALQDMGEDTDAVMDAVRTRLRALTDDRGEVLSAAQVASATYDDLEKRMNGEMSGIMTDLPDLNHVTGGFQRGELTTIGARPGVGKSAFAVGMALFAGQKNYRSLVCSREMSKEQYGQRIVSNLSGVNGMHLRRGQVNADELVQVTDALNDFAVLPMRFTFRTRTVEELRLVVQREMDTHGMDVLYVDYLQLMDTKQRTDNEALRLAKISWALKDIALDCNIAVVALAQVKRTEGRAAVMPILSDLRGSGSLEQDSDNVIFLHHPEAQDDPSIMPEDRAGFADYESRGMQYIAINVAKQRQGQTGTFGVIFQPDTMRYTGIMRDRELGR